MHLGLDNRRMRDYTGSAYGQRHFGTWVDSGLDFVRLPLVPRPRGGNVMSFHLGAIAELKVKDPRMLDNRIMHRFPTRMMAERMMADALAVNVRFVEAR